jgi:Flp pilus assembly pilin Flp
MNGLNPLTHPALRYARSLAGSHLARLSAAWRRRDAGASAIELAIITAILVALAFIVVLVIKAVVTNNCNNINTAANNGNGSGGGTCT